MPGGWRIISSYQGVGDTLIAVTRWIVENPQGEQKLVLTNSHEDESDVGDYIARGEVYDLDEI